jgi:transcriptional regulator with XRE-family HTH domain
MTQTEMAKALNLKVHYSAVSNYELGTREPDLLTILKYAELAGVSTDTLIDDRRKL